MDTGTKTILPVTIKNYSYNYNEARFYSFVLNKAFNSQLKRMLLGKLIMRTVDYAAVAKRN